MTIHHRPKTNPALFNTIVLIGHRCVGKTHTGKLLAEQLGYRFIDLDQWLEKRHGKDAGTMVVEDPLQFRIHEKQAFKTILESDATSAPLVLSLGAGCEYLPPGPLYVWLARDGWENDARELRPRLDNTIAFDDEITSMQQHREPRWKSVAHIYYHTPVGRSINYVARDIATYIHWFRLACHSRLSQKSYFVPTSSSRLPWMRNLYKALDMAGIEIRSDIFQDIPTLDVPLLASLRHPELSWLYNFPDAAWDIDIQYLKSTPPGVIKQLFAAHTPRPLILSTHINRPTIKAIENLIAWADKISQDFSEWRRFLAVKYAPSVHTISDLELFIDHIDQLNTYSYPITALPQGRYAAWLRPILAHSINHSNYIADASFYDHRGAKNISIYDLQQWLAYLPDTDDAPVFDILLGRSVDQSQGVLWHRRESLKVFRNNYYLKVSTNHDDHDLDNIDRLFTIFHRLGIRGASITSPYKRRIVNCTQIHNAMDIPAANTLLRQTTGWKCIDTDAIGMTACLDELESRGIEPGTVAIFGKGGVSPALIRAIDSSSWTLLYHTGARTGWCGAKPDSVQLIINAAGPNNHIYKNPPQCTAWIDLHYNNVAKPPFKCIHLNGDIFFEAQARAQRNFWETN